MAAARPTIRDSLRRLKRILGRFAPELRRERFLIAGSIVALIFEAAFRLLEPWPLKYVLDRVTGEGPRKGAPAVGWIAEMSLETFLIVAALAVLAFAGLRALFSYLSTIGLALAGNRVLTTVRSRLYRHLQGLSLSYHSKARTGDIVSRLTGDIGRLQEVSVTAAMPLVANVLTLMGMAVVMLVIDLRLGLLALSVLPLFALSLGRRTKRIRTAARTQRLREGDLAAAAAESMSAIKVVQALSLEKTLERAFARQNRASLAEGVQTKRLSAGLERRVDVLTGAGTALVLWYGARLVARGEITPGDLVLFLLYLKTAFKPLRDMAKYAGRLASAAASGERVLDVLDTEPEIRDRPDAVEAPAFRGDVRLARVTAAYETGRPVLRSLDLHVPAGTSVALVGPSGEGKSTLVSLLLRLYDPEAGAVMIDGRDIREYTLESLRRQVAIVLQESVLFAGSIRDNIIHGFPEATDEEIEAAARLAGAHDFIKRLPDGYDTLVGERGATLSGGERQRIAVARAAVRRAPIVLLDEPTNGLDEENERLVTEALRRLVEGRTTILIAHDLTQARDADRIAYLEGGRVLEYGSHEQLMTRGGRYASVYRLQAGTEELRGTARRRRRRFPGAAARRSREVGGR